MQKFIFFFIFLPSFQCFQSEECFKAKKTAVLIFYYYPGPAKDNARVEITSYILPQSQVDTAYYLSGNETSRNTLRVLNVGCVQTKNNRIPCLQKSQSSYIAIEHITEDGCVMKLEGTSHQIKTFIHSIYLKKFPRGFNLTCIIGRIYDASNLINENPLAKTSLISIIFLSSCAIITCGLCIGWLGFSYCRQFKQRRLKRRQQKVLENAVRKFLEKSPVILFNSKIKSQDFTDDDPMCAVCLESFNDNEKLRKLMCSHYFHIACIDPWLLAHQNCPLCNQNILNEPIQTISGRITLTNDESTNTPVVVVS